VRQFAKNLEEEINIALKAAEETGKPSFLYFDEGSILAQKSDEGTSVSKHYQEAIDVLKRYVGNDRRFVIGISTNELRETLEAAVTREGRLKSFFIGYPDTEQRQRMWKYFSGKYRILQLDDEQAKQLAETAKAEQGAFIEEFCRNYESLRRKKDLAAKGYGNLVDALKKGEKVVSSKVRPQITFDTLYHDARHSLNEKYERLSEEFKNEKHVGFVSSNKGK